MRVTEEDAGGEWDTTGIGYRDEKHGKVRLMCRKRNVGMRSDRLVVLGRMGGKEGEGSDRNGLGD